MFKFLRPTDIHVITRGVSLSRIGISLHIPGLVIVVAFYSMFIHGILGHLGKGATIFGARLKEKMHGDKGRYISINNHFWYCPHSNVR